MIDDKGLSLLYGEITGESSEKNESRNKTVKLANVATPRNEKVLPIDVPELSFIGLDDIEAHTMKQLGSKVTSGLKSSAKRFYKGDLLYSRLRPYLNKVWRSNNDGICSSEFIVIPENENIDTRFLAYRLNATDFVAFANSLNAGDRPRVDFKQISLFEIPAFSLSQQQEVVVKIEELFSELDSGIASLKTARDQLKIYRQALLKHAFEGKLTEQWRKDNADKLETPEQLLAHIQTERETSYQQQLDEWKQAVKDWEAKGKEGKKPSKPAKPSKLQVVASVANLPWCFVNYEGVCELIRNGISAKPIGDSGTKIFRISAVRAMSFDLNDIRYINNEDGQYGDFFLKKGDLVFTRYNGTREYVGVCAEYKGDETHLYPDKLILTRLGVQSILASFLEKAFATGISRNFIEEKIRTTAGQSGISGGDIKSTPIPICSLAEQQEIVSQLEEKLSIIEQNEKEIEDALAKAELLRQSILKKAFSGLLV